MLPVPNVAVPNGTYIRILPPDPVLPVALMLIPLPEPLLPRLKLVAALINMDPPVAPLAVIADKLEIEILDVAEEKKMDPALVPPLTVTVASEQQSPTGSVRPEIELAAQTVTFPPAAPDEDAFNGVPKRSQLLQPQER